MATKWHRGGIEETGYRCFCFVFDFSADCFRGKSRGCPMRQGMFLFRVGRLVVFFGFSITRIVTQVRNFVTDGSPHPPRYGARLARYGIKRCPIQLSIPLVFQEPATYSSPPMARITVEDCLDRVSSRFDLVMLASIRVRQLQKGAKPCLVCDNREVVIALREIAANKVRWAIPRLVPAE